MSCLALYLLGPPRIERDGVPVQVDTRKATALLAYLAVSGESHRRASLVNLLWPEYDRSRGRAALRRTLYSLTKAAVRAWLEVDREEIGLDPEADVWVDVDQFHQHLAGCEHHGHPAAQVCPVCVPPLTEAVGLVRGEFLSGFGLRDSGNFDDWAFFQARALCRELVSALDRLVLWHSTQRDFEMAVGYATRRLALDPLDEQAHCRLMQLYAWSGQRSAALSQYQECAKVLEDQLGVPPQGETIALYRRIKGGRAPLLPVADSLLPAEEGMVAGTRPSPDGPASLPAQTLPFLEGEGTARRAIFVAREGELVKLSTLLDASLGGHGQVAFIIGDAGSGKTALIQAFARQAQAEHPDLVVAWGHGNAYTGIGDPYLPFREVLGLLTGDVEAPWAAGAMTGQQARRLWHLLPLTVQALVEAGPDLVDLFVIGASLIKRVGSYSPWPDGSRWRNQLEKLIALPAASPTLKQSALFEQYCQVLQSVARQKPLLLALDDLQWVDEGSINLLFHLGRRIEGSRILVLGAYRPTEVALGWPAAPSATGPRGERERHPLESISNEFKRTFGDIEVDLHQAEGRQFVEAYLDSESNRLGDAFRESLHQHTAGIPLFTVELLRGMQERGNLVRDGEGRWVEGQALDWETLPARVEAVIAERIDRVSPRLRDILTVASVEGETFTAEAVAQVAGTDVGETIHCLSDTLDRKHRLVSGLGVLLHNGQNLSRYRFRHILFQKHLYNGLDPVKRVHLHQAVGTALETLYGEKVKEREVVAPQLARHFQEAGIAEEAVEYLHQAGERAQRLYANVEAIRFFRQALVLLKDAPPGRARPEWQQEMAAQIHESLGDVLEWTGEHDGACAAYQEALARIPKGDQIRQSQLHQKVGNVWRLQGRHEDALQSYDLAETALEEGAIKPTPKWWQRWVQIQLERMWAYYWLGEWRKISELADQVRSTVEQQGTPSQCISLFLCLASMNNRRDRYVGSEEALGLCHIALAISQGSEDLSERAWVRFVLGFTQLWHGDLGEAEKQIQAALALAEDTGDIVHQSRCLTYLTILCRKRGQLERARQYASRSLTAATAGQMVEYIGMARANLAWVAWREGDLAQTEADGLAALELWEQLPAGHPSCSFQWTAVWPLMGVAIARHRSSEVSRFVHALLEPTQQRLCDALTAVVQDAVKSWEGGDPEAARTYLCQGLEMAQELGYL